MMRPARFRTSKPSHKKNRRKKMLSSLSSAKTKAKRRECNLLEPVPVVMPLPLPAAFL